jgi:uncharacterized membrane protein
VATAFLHVFQAATSIAMLLWSAMIVRKAALSRGIGYAGLLIGAATIAALVTGFIDKSHHAFAMSILLQVLWLIGIGVELCRQPQPSTA